MRLVQGLLKGTLPNFNRNHVQVRASAHAYAVAWSQGLGLDQFMVTGLYILYMTHCTVNMLASPGTVTPDALHYVFLLTNE